MLKAREGGSVPRGSKDKEGNVEAWDNDRRPATPTDSRECRANEASPKTAFFMAPRQLSAFAREWRPIVWTLRTHNPTSYG